MFYFSGLDIFPPSGDPLQFTLMTSQMITRLSSVAIPVPSQQISMADMQYIFDVGVCCRKLV